jgi:D-sedoheptulose 7-phosphate isomerase
VNGSRSTGLPTGTAHVDALVATLTACGPGLSLTAERWGRQLADLLPRGHRLLVAGNGGSAAQAQHLTAELVGRYRHDRAPLSAIALHAETSTLTAVLNDYGADEVYARQVAAHGRPRDVLILLSTSGRSPNVVRAAQAGTAGGLTVWAMTGRSPNPLAGLADESIVVDGPSTATVQEVHLVALHLVCAALDVALGVCPETLGTPEAVR